MRFVYLAFPLAALAACISPLEQCLSNATSDLRVVTRLAAATEANLARGFALETDQVVRVIRRRCSSRNRNGSRSTHRCDRTLVRNVTTEVAIDLGAERAKLASLRQQQARLEANAAGAVAQCRQLHPA